MAEMSDDTAHDAQSKVLIALQPLRADGWQIEVESEGAERVGFYVEHPLSTRSGFSLTSGSGVDSVLRRILASREVAVVASAPKDTPRERLLGEIRNAARAWEWPETVVPQVAVALHASDVISHEEMEWLIEAGAVQSIA